MNTPEEFSVSRNILEPCPFCGNKSPDQYIVGNSGDAGGEDILHIKCSNCHAEMAGHETSTMKRWNTRPSLLNKETLENIRTGWFQKKQKEEK